MNSHIKSKWVEALRSGKYKQTTGLLKEGDAYCCLGVLCDVYSKTKKKAGVKFNDFDAFSDGKSTMKAVLSSEILTWAGLLTDKSESYGIPFIIIDNKEQSLASLNDHGSTFNEIADLIEKHL